jgi:hypothetical protein
MTKEEQLFQDLKIHDKNIKGLETTEDKKLIIYIEDNDRIIELRFINVKHLKIDNFRLGNIILDIEVYEQEYLNKHDEELRSLLDMDRTITSPYLDKIKEDIGKGELILLSLQSSYGAYGSILCESVESKIRPKKSLPNDTNF